MGGALPIKASDCSLSRETKQRKAAMDQRATLVRRPAQAGRVYATDQATGTRRDLTYEEKRAFWALAIVEVLRHTGIRVEELAELTHHSFAEIHRVRNRRRTLPLVAAYDPYERTWSAPVPYLFQRQHGPEHHVLSWAVIRRYPATCSPCPA